MNINEFCGIEKTLQLVREYGQNGFDNESWFKTVGVLEVGFPNGKIINLSTDAIHTVNIYRAGGNEIRDPHTNDYLTAFVANGINYLTKDLEDVLVLDLKEAPAMTAKITGANDTVATVLVKLGETSNVGTIPFDIAIERELAGVDYSRAALSFGHYSDYLGAVLYAGNTPKKNDFRDTAGINELRKIYEGE